MAGGALEIAAVIQWLVKQAAMHIDMRNPGRRCVAVIALMNGIEVPEIRARCRGAIVAGRTNANYVVVIDRRCRRPGRRRMAVFAHGTGIHVIDGFARGYGAVMTFVAIPGDIHMVEIGRYPGHCCMTVIAVIAAGDMSRMFTGRDQAVMARRTDSKYLCVIYRVGRCPENIVVAVLANIGCVYMRWVLTGGTCAVMTIDAVARDVGMIEIRRNPRRGCVAVIAVVAAGNVRYVFAGCCCTVVAGHAGADDMRVIHCIDRRPKHVVVAVLANVACIDVRWVFARRNCAFVARRTRSKYLCVVDNIGWRPDDTVVATLAYVSRIDVREVFSCDLRIVMTANAVVGDASVIERRRNPRVRCMTIVAGITASKMRWVFAGGRRAVVAGETRTDDLSVIDGVRRCEGDSIMAVDAQVSRIDVRQVFTDGIGAIMAADAITRDVGMVEVGRSPRRGRMAIVTGVAACKMRRVLAGCNSAVVAGEAGSDDLCMVHCIGRCPGNAAVAIFANVTRIDVRRVLAGRRRPVMTGKASTKDLGVIHDIDRCPDDIVVAILADIGRGDMCQVFARRIRAIVAINALIRDVHVVEIRRNPRS